MIGYIKGKVTSCEEGRIIIENNGIGYEINIPDSSEFSVVDGKNDEITVYTAMMVRDDDISLCGFKRKNDLQLFKKLLTVNGVGAKAALAMLNVMKADELSRAIVFEDVEAITRAPGIGKKTAQRIVLELKDKLGDISGLGFDEQKLITDISDSTETADARGEALMALMALGYSKSEGAEMIARIKEEYQDAQQYIKKALSSAVG